LSIRTSLGKRDRLGADAAAGLEHQAPGGVCGVGVQQIHERSGLIVEALVLPWVISVYVGFAHRSIILRERWNGSTRTTKRRVSHRQNHQDRTESFKIAPTA
jgi:hypothetical protein